MHDISLKNISFFVFTISINIFLVKLMAVSPVYLGFTLSMIVVGILFSVNPNHKFFGLNADDTVMITLICLLCVNASIATVLNLGSLKSLVTAVFSYLCFLFSFSVNTISKESVRRTFSIFRFLSILIFIVEAIYRFYYSVSKHAYFFFYDYKFNSIMFPDTNATAVCIEFFLCFLFYLKARRIVRISRIEICITLLLLILTFSRAALFGVFSLAVYWCFVRSSYIVKLFVIFCGTFSLFVIMSYFLMDVSFLTKIDIYVQTIKYIKKIDFFHFFVGNGFDSSIRFLSRYGHTYVTLYIIELGMNSLLVLIIFFLCILSKTKYSSFLVVPFLVTGLSYMPYVIPFFFLYLGFIYNIECHRNDLFYISQERKRHGKLLCICFAYRR